MNMMNLSNQPTIKECKEKWSQIIENEQLEMITKERLKSTQIPEQYLKYQNTAIAGLNTNEVGSTFSNELFNRQK